MVCKSGSFGSLALSVGPQAGHVQQPLKAEKVSVDHPTLPKSQCHELLALALQDPLLTADLKEAK
jgi:hypothetical protein